MLRRVDGILARGWRPRPRATQARAGGSRRASAKVWGGTFHATATRLLRLHGRSIGLDPSFTILDRGDAEDLWACSAPSSASPRTTAASRSRAPAWTSTAAASTPASRWSEAVETHFPWCKDEVDDLRRLFAAYVDHKGEQSVLDYDDLLLFWHGLLTEPRAARSIRSRFDHVLVDEYQDTNRLQAEILQMLCPGGKNLTVVGDDAQAIYSFRAATVRNILDFPQQFPGHPRRHPGAELPQHPAHPRRHQRGDRRRRRTPRQEPVVARAEAGPSRSSCPAKTRTSRPSSSSSSVLDHREAGLALRRQAVLFRASHHSLALELELTRRNIPFHKYGGLRFVETAHVKDLMAFLRLAENPRDLMAGTRVLMLLPGVGPKKARALMDRLAAGPATRCATRRSRPPSAGGIPAPGRAGAGRPARGFAAWTPPGPIAGGRAWAAGPLMTGIGVATRRSRLADQAHPALLRAAPGAPLRQRPRPPHGPGAARMAGRPLPRPRPLSRRDHPRPAQLHRGPGRAARSWTRTSSSSPPCTRPRGWSGTRSSSSTPPTATSPPTWPPASLEEIEEERRLFYVALTRAKDWLYVCYPAALLRPSPQLQRRARLRSAHALPSRGRPRALRAAPGLCIARPTTSEAGAGTARGSGL